MKTPNGPATVDREMVGESMVVSVRGLAVADLNNGFLVPCDGYTVASFTVVDQGSTALSTGVLSAIVANDPGGAQAKVHPAAVALSTATVTGAFTLGYAFVGVMVTTVQSGVVCDVYLTLRKGGVSITGPAGATGATGATGAAGSDAADIVLGCKTNTTSYNTSSTETVLNGTFTAASADTVAANALAVGKTIRLRARGYYSTPAAGAGTLTIRVRVGGVSGTIVAQTSAQTLGTSMANRAWHADVDFTCRTAGGSGTVFGMGTFFRATSAVGSAVVELVSPGTPPAAITIDTTAAAQWVITSEFSVSDVANEIACTDMTLELLN